MDRIILGGGCFWCLEAVYQEVEGVTKVESGYMGGPRSNPTYEEVCSGKSGHVEVVRVAFDPAVVSLRKLLEIFFTIHDPTTLNRQGSDAGPQYRSVIFYGSDDQKSLAEEMKCEIEGAVTAIEPASEFFRAEEYHQNYFRNNPNQGYCSFVVAPKVKKYRAKFTSAS